MTKAGKPRKRPKTQRGYRIPTQEDNNLAQVEAKLEKLAKSWERDNILPTEDVQTGDKTKTLLDYGMPKWRDIFNPRQLLAHGYCVQAFQELVDEDRAAGDLSESRQAAWCYVAFALDKLINTNSLLCRWHSNRQVVASTFDSHDFGMKWSYSEMAVAIEGLGLEWAINNVENCISDLVHMVGHKQGRAGVRN